MRFLFVSYSAINCGVNQFGQNVFRALTDPEGDREWGYAPVSTQEQLDTAIASFKPDVTIYNWHGATLGMICHPENARRHPCVNIGLMHELSPAEAAALPRRYFHGYMVADPSFPRDLKAVKVLPRCLPRCEQKVPIASPDRPWFGCFGFAVSSKGWERLPEIVSASYPEALIRLHIPDNWAIDPMGDLARTLVKYVACKAPQGIEVDSTHYLLPPHTLLKWLAMNTANIFPYHPYPHSGISSSVDWAIAAGRPIAITRSGLFKHLHHLPILLEERSLKEIVEDGDKHVRHLREEWSQENFVKAFYQALEELYAA